MVHALRDAWRVASPRGVLIDLRPLPGLFPVDAVVGSRQTAIGEVDATATADDDHAADEAVAAAVRSGWLIPQRHVEFEIQYYWDTTADMADQMRSGRKVKRVTPSYEEIDAALAATGVAGGGPARLRSARQLALSSYAKGPGSV